MDAFEIFTDNISKIFKILKIQLNALIMPHMYPVASNNG